MSVHLATGVQNVFTVTKLAALALIIGTGMFLLAYGDPYRDSFEARKWKNKEQ
jgi:hypothetical protein